MAEQTFRSPGFFEQEIELIAGDAGPIGTPAGLAGTSQLGPAFVPVTVGNFQDFQSRFGGLNQEMPATFAANEWLKNKSSLTFVRTLGAGANSTAADINETKASGTVKNAGFVISGSLISSKPEASVFFIAASHDINTVTDYSLPVFADNPTFDPSAVTANMVRGMIFAASGTRVEVLDHNEFYALGNQLSASVGTSTAGEMQGKFKIVISSSVPSFSSYKDGSFSGVRVLTASLDPKDPSYIANVLNTDVDLFEERRHLLYAHFPIDAEIARVQSGSAATVAMLYGSDDWLNKFGRFDTRYKNARTTSFISQPYGEKEFDLFHFECISDGESANSLYKISVQNVVASTNVANPYGTFDVVLRQFGDDDRDPKIIESYPKVSLDPNSENYIARMIGDKKVQYNFDASDPEERGLVITGKFPNRSKLIRVVVHENVENKRVPAGCLPFGFRGLPVVRTAASLSDNSSTLTFDGMTFSGSPRLTTIHDGADLHLTSSVLPPVPYRFKVTRGKVTQAPNNIGEPEVNERPDSRLYWGVMFQSVTPGDDLNVNEGTEENKLIRNFSKFLGIEKQDVLASGDAADVFNANKFSLSRVALAATDSQYVTGSVDSIMRGASYVRNGAPDSSTYKVKYGAYDRVTLATLVSSSPTLFNRFTPYAKFTNVFYGGFDGLNVLDKDNRMMNDKASSVESGGKARGEDLGGLTKNVTGARLSNNLVQSYRSAINLLTDNNTSRANIVSVPGIREPMIQDYMSERVRENSMMVHIRDIASYDDTGSRVWDDSVAKPNIDAMIGAFSGLNIDNSYVSAYYPDVFIEDPRTSKRVKCPASIAALGAISYNDKISYPWFAPAGFNRGALDFVKNVTVRLNSSDRDKLYDARINPIATFPSDGYVIFGQKTLQLAKSSLDRLNVRRLVVEVKRIISEEAIKIVFEQNTQAVRNRFIDSMTPRMSLIKSQAGVERFEIIMNSSNNTQKDADELRVNGKVLIVPTRTIEFIAIDFVITSSGVIFS